MWDLYNKAHTPLNWHEKLFKYAKSLGIKIFSTPFDSTAVSDQDFIDASLCGNGIDGSKGGLIGANAWFAPGEGTGEFHAYMYVSHQ